MPFGEPVSHFAFSSPAPMPEYSQLSSTWEFVKLYKIAHLTSEKLPGFKIVVHGGQGAQGTGKASVLDDTWQFNLFTLDWSRLTYASDSVPVASNLAVAPIMENTAVAFGGLAQDGTPSGKLFWYHAPKT